jgi:hypothetical protein
MLRSHSVRGFVFVALYCFILNNFVCRAVCFSLLIQCSLMCN